jgi:DNA-binding CsgD family transcriptional regulator
MADAATRPRRRTMITPAAGSELPAVEPKDDSDDLFWVAWRQYLRASPARLKTTARKPVIEAAFPQAGSGNQREVLRSFFDLSGICMARLDSNIRLIETNADFSHQFQRLPAELCGTHFCDLLHKDFQTRVSEQFTRMLAQQHPRFTEPMIAFRQKDSTIFDGELTAFTLRSHEGGIDSLAAVVCPDDWSRNGRASARRKLLLTDLDVRILEGVAAGMSTVSLASKLYLSRGGIEYHVDILFRKLKVNNRPALIAKAYSLGVLCPGWPPRVHPDYLKEPLYDECPGS